jgi:hypothetical protein
MDKYSTSLATERRKGRLWGADQWPPVIAGFVQQRAEILPYSLFSQAEPMASSITLDRTAE